MTKITLSLQALALTCALLSSQTSLATDANKDASDVNEQIQATPDKPIPTLSKKEFKAQQKAAKEKFKAEQKVAKEECKAKLRKSKEDFKAKQEKEREDFKKSRKR